VNSKEEELLDRSFIIEDELTLKLEQLLPTLAEDLLQLQQASPSALAYLGDAVYELYIRRYYLLPPKRSQVYHRLVVAQVRAEAQASHLRSLTPYLTSTELDIVRRGRNATTKPPKRIEPEIYQQASSLETLVGYLFLTDCQRLAQLLHKLDFEQNQNE